MTYRRITTVAFLAFSCFLIQSCTKSSTTTTKVGNWVRRGDFDGVARGEAVSAVLNNKLYAGLGFDGTNRLSDFWEYDGAADLWRRKKDFPGTPRNAAVAFSAGGKVYVGLGYDGVNKLNDFWQYDPVADSWTQVANFGGSARYGATAFTLNDKGYVVAGFDGNPSKEMWMYDPGTNTWTIKTGPGSKRYDAVAFVINNIAYLVTGTNNGTYNNDFWAYDPASDAWTEKRKITNSSTDNYDDLYTTIIRSAAAAFVIDGKGYLAVGQNGGYLTNVWEYDPVADTWLEKTSFQGTTREGAIGFSLNNRGYVGLGRSSAIRLDDVREFQPTVAENDNDD
jgi:N-acetylneuraminic acid mutarotase